MEKYVNELPLVVKNSLKALSDENRQKIMLHLLNEGSKSFMDISKDLNVSKNNLSHHIKTLMRYGLIYNFYNKNRYKDKYSFYELSKLGTKIIINLIDIMNLKIEPKEERIVEDEILGLSVSSDIIFNIQPKALITIFTAGASLSRYSKTPEKFKILTTSEGW